MSTSVGPKPLPVTVPQRSVSPPPTGSDVNWIDLHPFQSFALLSFFYFIVTAALSSLKLLWLDELITVNMARLGSVRAIWQALSAGADPNPPLTHMAVLAFSRIFGPHAYVYRLPAILGYWFGLLALFLFLKRRVPPTWALTAVLICMGMGGFEWSFDCRSYAIFFGTTMLAFLCWSRAADSLSNPGVRRRSLLGMTCFLAAGICTNYFAVLAVLPIAFGELTRTGERAQKLWKDRQRSAVLLRAVDWPIWLCLVLAGTPLLVFHAAIQTSIALFQPYAWNKVYFGMAELAYLEMVEAMLVPLCLLFLFAGMLWVLSKPCDACRTRLYPRPLRALAEGAAHPRPSTVRGRPYEVVAVLVLMLYPYLGWAIASLHGGMLSSRMVIPVGLGFAIAVVCVGYRTFGQVRGAGTVVLLLFVLWFMVRESYIGYSYQEQKEAFYDTLKALRTVDNGKEPIVVSDNMLVAPLYEYAPPDVKSRVLYVMDVPEIMRYRHQASGEVNFWAGRKAYGFPIVPLAPFQHAVSDYLVIASGDDWLVDALREHHYSVDPLPADTHAEPLNFATSPLSRYKPNLFKAQGDQALPASAQIPPPEPFTLQDELPHPFQYDGSFSLNRLP